jgi:hypothetical protein
MDFPSGLLFSGLPTKVQYVPLLSPYVLLVLPISVFLTWLDLQLFELTE